jgi:hypothetical protein
MNNSAVSYRRQRLAWIMLFVSFFACAAISVAVPVAASAYVQNATREMLISVQANRGTVGLDDANGVRRAVIAGEGPQVVAVQGRVLTDSTANATLLFSTVDEETVVVRANVDSNTSLGIIEAASPRFALSSGERVIELELESGRLRLTVPSPLLGAAGAASPRDVATRLLTPHGQVTLLEPGQYTVSVDNQATEIIVEEGAASLIAGAARLIVNPGERAAIPTGGIPEGPLSPQRTLIANGDFSEGFANWSEYTWRVELADQPAGRTTVTNVDGEPVLRFERGGIGHADARLRQSIDQNVADFDSLQLAVTLRILDQSLGVCGVQGSECPLFVRIDYIDENGTNQVWLHGFYATGEVDDNTTPGACISCAVIQSSHDRVPLGQEYFFEVDLREELARQGALPPRIIESVSLIASGHSFITEVIDVSLVAE